jgi:cytochrome c oxidase subunit 2
MKGVIEVVDQEEFDAIMAKQKPYYYTAFPEKDPSAAPADTTVVAAVVKNN